MRPNPRMVLRVRWLVTAVCCTLSWACVGEGSETSTYSARDSVGVLIVTSVGPAWENDEAWTVASEPTVEIGVVEGTDPYQLHDVLGATRMSDGRIAILDGGKAELRFFEGSGEFLEAVGGEGEGPGEFNRPTGLHRLPGDSLMVSMFGDSERSLFSPRGEFVRIERSTFGSLSRLVGGVWECPGRPGLLLPDGSYLACVGKAPERNPLAEHPRVSHYLVRVPYDLSWADTLGVLYGPIGPGPLMFGPLGTQIASSGRPLRIYVGDPAFFEIDVFEDRKGRTMSIRYPSGLTPVTSADKAEFVRFAEERSPPGVPRPSADMFPWASNRPGFEALHADELGYLWAVEDRPRWESVSSARVFSAEGYLLGTVDLPPGLEILEIGSDYVLGLWHDEFDVQYVRLHGLQRE
jgi:hypothetical protein